MTTSLTIGAERKSYGPGFRIDLDFVHRRIGSSDSQGAGHHRNHVKVQQMGPITLRHPVDEAVHEATAFAGACAPAVPHRHSLSTVPLPERFSLSTVIRPARKDSHV